MVAIVDCEEQSAKENDTSYQEILKGRQIHAKSLEQDYSHVFRKKSLLDLVRLSLIVFGVELAYSAETSFIAPILLTLGIDHQHMTMVWSLSPFLAFFISPILGSISDRCSSRFGRRRPFILILSIGLVIGLIFAPWGRDIGAMLENIGNFEVANITNVEVQSYTHDSRSFLIMAAFTIFGAFLLNFAADNCLTIARAYILDVCLPEQHVKALSIFTIIAGLGGIFGFGLGAIDWDETILGEIIGDNVRIVFTLFTLLFIATAVITLTSFREIPLKLLQSDKMLRPVSQEEIRKRKEGKCDKEIFEIERADLDKNEKGNDNDRPVTLAMYLKSIIVMPKALRLLCLTNCLSWMGHILYCLYFTDFVGETVFRGDPTAAVGSEEHDLYDEGVRFGCWGKAAYALSCTCFSMIIGKVIKMFSAKYTFVGSQLLFAITMAILAYFPTKIGVIAFSTTAGLVYATLFTIPFLLVAQYHSKGTLKPKPKENINQTKGEESGVEFERGLGTDCGIVGSMLFVAQFTMSLSIGSLITLIDSVAAVLYAASFFSFLAAISGCFVIYLDI